jgi:hypothetical protein
MRIRYTLVFMLLMGFSASAFAEEVSLLSGFYRSQDDSPGFKQQTLSLGGRYGFLPAEDHHFWYVDAEVRSTSYSGDNAPDGASGILLGAGQKYFFRNFGKAIHTFLAWSAGFRSATSSDATTKTESSGLYYAGNGGFRFDFTKTLFMDMEAQLFNSSLVGTTKTTTQPAGTTAESKVTELQVDTFSGVDSLRFGVGMIF